MLKRPAFAPPPPQHTPSPQSVSTHSMFSYDTDNNSPVNNEHNTSLKIFHSDSIHHRPTPSPEPDPKKVKPNGKSDKEKITLNGVELTDEQTQTLIERVAKKMEERGFDFD